MQLKWRSATVQLPFGSTLTLRYTTPRLSRPDKVTVTGRSARPGPIVPTRVADPTGCEGRVGQAEPQRQVVGRCRASADPAAASVGRSAGPGVELSVLRPGRVRCARGRSEVSRPVCPERRPVAAASRGWSRTRARREVGRACVGGRRAVASVCRCGDGAAVVGRAVGGWVEGVGDVGDGGVGWSAVAGRADHREPAGHGVGADLPHDLARPELVGTEVEVVGERGPTSARRRRPRRSAPRRRARPGSRRRARYRIRR